MIKKNFFSSVKQIISKEFFNFVSFSKENKTLYYLLFVVLILSYGFELSHFTLSIDEEYGIFGGNLARTWLAQGRFGVAILKKMMNNSGVVPFWTTALSIIFLYISVIYFCSIISTFLDKLKISKKMKIFLLFILGGSFLSFPTNAAYISFSTYNFEVSIGILLTALGVKFFINSIFEKNKKNYLILSILLLIFSIGIYQSFVFLFLCSISFVSILNILNKNSNYSTFKKNFNILLRLFFVILISVILYKVIDMLFAIRYPSMGYIEGFIRWGRRSFMENFLAIKRFYWSDVFNNKALFFYKFFFVSVGLGLLAVLRNLFLVKNNRISYLIWCLILFISPWLLTILLGSETPLRTMQTVAFLSGSLLVFVILSFKNKFIFLILSIFSILVIFLQSQQLSLIFSSDHFRYQQDVILANRIFNKIYDMELGEKLKYPVVFTGRIRQEQTRQNIKMETLGYSFFEWDNGNPWRIYSFLKFLGYDLKSPNIEQVEIGLECQKDMPSWPDDNSLQLCEDLLIIKLSEQ